MLHHCMVSSPLAMLICEFSTQTVVIYITSSTCSWHRLGVLLGVNGTLGKAHFTVCSNIMLSRWAEQ